jgi:hypothetical protein
MKSKVVETDWWDKPKEDAWSLIGQITKQLEGEQIARKNNHERAMRLYGIDHRIGDSVVTHVYTPGRKALALNVVRNICSTVVAEVCQSKPHPTFLTTRGNWGLQRKAKKMEQYSEGDFYNAKIYDTSPQVFRDCTLFDGGLSKVCEPAEGDTDIADERVLPWELLVPGGGFVYGNPRHIYQQKFVDRSVLRSFYPGKKEEIDGCSRHTSYSQYSGYQPSVSSDMVLVTEGWRLPDRKGKQGRHAITIEGATLDYKPWAFDWFPFDVMRWAEWPVGFWGDSLAQQLVGIQYEINLTIRRIQEAHHLLGKSHILWPKGCGMPKAHANNQEATIWEYDPARGAPQVVNGQAVHPEAYDWIDRLYAKAHEIVGVSQSAAQNRMPAGITGSGKAQLVFDSLSSKRYVLPGQMYEAYHMQKSGKRIDIRKSIAKRDGKQVVKWSGRRNGSSYVEEIDWKDCFVDGYVMKVFPTSKLPSDPVGRTATVEQWINAGWITRESGMRLLEFPDLDQEMSLELASWDIITDMIERMLYAEDPDAEGVYQSPIPQMSLVLAEKVCAGAYLRARLDGAPEGNLRLLLDWMAAIADLIEMADAANAPPPQPMNPAGPPDAGVPLGPEEQAA